MTFLEMQTLLGYYLAEAAPSWFTADIRKEYINRAYQELYAEAVKNNQNHFALVTSVNLVAGTETYTLPTTTLKVLAVEYVPTTERVVTLRQIDVIQRGRYLNQQYQVNLLGEPVYYLRGNLIGVLPVPTSSLANGLRVTHVPSVTLLSADADTPPAEWPAEHHEVIVFGALKRCRFRDKDAVASVDREYERLKLLFLETTAIRVAQEPEMIVDTQWD